MEGIYLKEITWKNKKLPKSFINSLTSYSMKTLKNILCKIAPWVKWNQEIMSGLEE